MTTLTPQRLKFYIFLAIVSLFATLWLPYVGEEAIYTISAYEMWFQHHYWVNTIYGTFYGRPPLLNWFIIPLLKIIGWQHVLIASRFVSAAASALVAVGVYWFVRRLLKNAHFALLCAAIYLTGDLLMVRGWLAYADPLLSFFIFYSIAFLWLGVEEEKNRFFILGVACLGFGFLVKALSPFWFYGLAGLALLILHPNRRFLLRPTSILIHVCALGFPYVWNVFTDARYFPIMWQEATNTAFAPSLGKYIYQVLVVQPGTLLFYLMPMSLITLFYYFKQVCSKPTTDYYSFVRIAFWIALLNFVVCWFAPRWPESRYYMPVFPLMAICMAYVIWNANARAFRLTAVFLALVLLEKALFVGFYYYRANYLEPNYKAITQNMMKIVGKKPLLADNRTIESAPVEKAAIYLNLMRYPLPPIQMAPEVVAKKNPKHLAYTGPSQRTCNGVYVLGQIPTIQDRIIMRYSKGKRLVYLFCRGKA